MGPLLPMSKKYESIAALWESLCLQGTRLPQKHGIHWFDLASIGWPSIRWFGLFLPASKAWHILVWSCLALLAPYASLVLAWHRLVWSCPARLAQHALVWSCLARPLKNGIRWFGLV